MNSVSHQLQVQLILVFQFVDSVLPVIVVLNEFRLLHRFHGRKPLHLFVDGVGEVNLLVVALKLVVSPRTLLFQSFLWSLMSCEA